MAKAMADADLVIESLSEDPKAKIAFYQQMRRFFRKDSYCEQIHQLWYRVHLLSTQEDRKKYLALHFAK